MTVAVLGEKMSRSAEAFINTQNSNIAGRNSTLNQTLALNDTLLNIYISVEVVDITNSNNRNIK
jgi:hypothetical protein